MVTLYSYHNPTVNVYIKTFESKNDFEDFILDLRIPCFFC